MREDLWDICLDIYRQMFKEAEPSADFDKMLASGEAKRPDFFMDYYLDQDRQDIIMAFQIGKHRLNRIQADAVRTEVCLGCAPKGVRE